MRVPPSQSATRSEARASAVSLLLRAQGLGEARQARAEGESLGIAEFARQFIGKIEIGIG